MKPTFNYIEYQIACENVLELNREIMEIRKGIWGWASSEDVPEIQRIEKRLGEIRMELWALLK